MATDVLWGHLPPCTPGSWHSLSCRHTQDILSHLRAWPLCTLSPGHRTPFALSPVSALQDPAWHHSLLKVSSPHLCCQSIQGHARQAGHWSSQETEAQGPGGRFGIQQIPRAGFFEKHWGTRGPKLELRMCVFLLRWSQTLQALRSRQSGDLAKTQATHGVGSRWQHRTAQLPCFSLFSFFQKVFKNMYLGEYIQHMPERKVLTS